MCSSFGIQQRLAVFTTKQQMNVSGGTSTKVKKDGFYE